jgi:predicted nicotinamide N-methyase
MSAPRLKRDDGEETDMALHRPTDHELELIQRHTQVVCPPVLPALQLRLVTPDSAWWHLTPEDLAPCGIVDPYWAFCWPGGTALARFILDHPHLVQDKRVLDFGCGCGVVGIAAAHGKAASVIFNDIDPWALWASSLNLKLNKEACCPVEYLVNDLVDTRPPEVEVIFVGDVTYSREMVKRIWPWLCQAAAQGTCVYLADPGRGYLPRDLTAAATLRVPSENDSSLTQWVDVPIHHLQACEQRDY